MGVSYRTAEERFWMKVNKIKKGCFMWRGCLNNGHAMFRASPSSSPVLARRWAWESLKGKIPERTFLIGTCGSRACVNPDHHVLSMSRMMGRTKLNRSDAVEILRLRAQIPKVTVRTMMAMFRVGRTTINNIIYGKTRWQEWG